MDSQDRFTLLDGDLPRVTRTFLIQHAASKNRHPSERDGKKRFPQRKATGAEFQRLPRISFVSDNPEKLILGPK